MKEEMKNEIEKYAEKLGITVEQAQADFDNIVAQHSLDLEDNAHILFLSCISCSYQ